MSKPCARIATQLGIALAVILAVVISNSSIFALRSLDAANLIIREEHMASEARLLADQLTTFHSTLRDSTQRLSGLFDKRFSAGLTLQADPSISVAGVPTPGLYLDGQPLNNDFTEVDTFRDPRSPPPPRSKAAPPPCSAATCKALPWPTRSSAKWSRTWPPRPKS